MSRRHAELCLTGLVPTVRDLNSTNGIFVNGHQVITAPLKVGDVLRVGEWIGVMVTVDAGDAVAALMFQEIAPGYWEGPALRARLAAAHAAAPSDLPVIIEGETGVGKEGVARCLHLASGRPGPFVAVNCAAIPEPLAEGELFGHRKGAFTGAERSHLGYFRAAQGGTLFLDEIVELSPPVQAKLLRALEQREVIPLGETRPVEVDVRIVSAAQAPLAQAVAAGRFRGDLYARLDGMSVSVPPLRQRVEEVPFLFAQRLKHHAGPRPVPALDLGTVERLCLYAWPFNVRELDLLARQMIAVHGGAPVLKRSHLPERFQGAGRAPGADSGQRQPRTEQPPTAQEFLVVLAANGGNVSHAAHAAGISRAKAYRLLQKSPAGSRSER
jgi:transcriptional regulator with PAS, ATPase and Fis domain